MLSKVLIFIFVVLSVACNRSQNNAPAASPFDAGVVAKGRDLFLANCAECHGPQAQGHPDWQTPSDGSFAAAPPLNGTGNEHLRSKSQLVATIKQGVRRDGVDIMPAWGTRLSDGDIEAILVWLQSLWPTETYQTWLKTQSAAQAGTPSGTGAGPSTNSLTNPH